MWLDSYSIVLFYWFGGAFLMSTKRLGEYRQLIGTEALDNLSNYRQSFGKYTEKSLLLSAYFYSMLSTFNISIFLVKYLGFLSEYNAEMWESDSRLDRWCWRVPFASLVSFLSSWKSNPGYFITVWLTISRFEFKVILLHN